MDILDYFGVHNNNNNKHNVTIVNNADDSLIDKYAPRKLAEFMGNYKQIQEIQNWFSVNKRGLFVVGPVGCGKTTLVRLACEQYGKHAFVMNASHKRTRKELYDYYNRIKHFTHNGIFIIDDTETFIGKNENVSISELSKWVSCEGTVNIIFIANSIYINKLSAIVSACTKTIYIEYPPTKLLFSRCLDICERESIDLSDCDMKKLKKMIESQREPRMVINSLRLLDVVYDVEKDVHMDIYDVYRTMIEPNDDFQKKLRYFQTDAGTIPIIFQENYIDAEGISTQALRHVSDTMSLADVYHKHMFMSISSTCLDTYACLSCIFPEYYYCNTNIKTSKMYKTPRFGLIWTKQSAMYQKKKYVSRFEEYYSNPIVNNTHITNTYGFMNDVLKHLIKEYKRNKDDNNNLTTFLKMYGLHNNNNKNALDVAFDLYNSFNLNPDEKTLTKKAFMGIVPDRYY